MSLPLELGMISVWGSGFPYCGYLEPEDFLGTDYAVSENGGRIVIVGKYWQFRLLE